MVTSIIGKIFLEAYNARYTTSYSAEQFFLEIFYPLFLIAVSICIGYKILLLYR